MPLMSKVRTASGQLIKEDEYIWIFHNTTITTSSFLKTASAAATKVIKQIITVKGQASVVEVCMCVHTSHVKYATRAPAPLSSFPSDDKSPQ